MDRLIVAGSELTEESLVPSGLDWVYSELVALGMSYDAVYLELEEFRAQHPDSVPARDLLLRAEDLRMSQRRAAGLFASPDSLAADVWREFESQRVHIRAVGRKIGETSKSVQGGEVTVGQYYRDSERQRVTTPELIGRGLVVPVEGSPRPRNRVAPNTRFYICYEGARQPYFDEQGCVECVINSLGLREREELIDPKPPGQRRVLCLGDSFTFGWGVRVEDAWPRRTEGLLRERVDDGIRTINCGLAGTLYPDEYRSGLVDRFHVLEPDVVIVGLCLNDLLLTNRTLAHARLEPEPEWWQSSHVLRDLVGFMASSGDYPSARMREELTFPADRDITREILAAPRGEAPSEGFIYWDSGVPQDALVEMRAWCDERGIGFGVVMWPFFQGLGPEETYPFDTIHELVAQFCAEQEIPILDLWPAFAGKHPTPDLWVTPEDLHGNPLAHGIAAEPIARFVETLLER